MTSAIVEDLCRKVFQLLVAKDLSSLGEPIVEGDLESIELPCSGLAKLLMVLYHDDEGFLAEPLVESFRIVRSVVSLSGPPNQSRSALSGSSGIPYATFSAMMLSCSDPTILPPFPTEMLFVGAHVVTALRSILAFTCSPLEAPLVPSSMRRYTPDESTLERLREKGSIINGGRPFCFTHPTLLEAVELFGVERWRQSFTPQLARPHLSSEGYLTADSGIAAMLWHYATDEGLALRHRLASLVADRHLVESGSLEMLWVDSVLCRRAARHLLSLLGVEAAIQFLYRFLWENFTDTGKALSDLDPDDRAIPMNVTARAMAEFFTGLVPAVETTHIASMQKDNLTRLTDPIYFSKMLKKSNISSAVSRTEFSHLIRLVHSSPESIGVDVAEYRAQQSEGIEPGLCVGILDWLSVMFMWLDPIQGGLRPRKFFVLAPTRSHAAGSDLDSPELEIRQSCLTVPDVFSTRTSTGVQISTAADDLLLSARRLKNTPLVSIGASDLFHSNVQAVDDACDEEDEDEESSPWTALKRRQLKKNGLALTTEAHVVGASQLLSRHLRLDDVDLFLPAVVGAVTGPVKPLQFAMASASGGRSGANQAPTEDPQLVKQLDQRLQEPLALKYAETIVWESTLLQSFCLTSLGPAVDRCLADWEQIRQNPKDFAFTREQQEQAELRGRSDEAKREIRDLRTSIRNELKALLGYWWYPSTLSIGLRVPAKPEPPQPSPVSTIPTTREGTKLQEAVERLLELKERREKLSNELGASKVAESELRHSVHELQKERDSLMEELQKLKLGVRRAFKEHQSSMQTALDDQARIYSARLTAQSALYKDQEELYRANLAHLQQTQLSRVYEEHDKRMASIQSTKEELLKEKKRLEQSIKDIALSPIGKWNSSRR